MIVGPIQFLDSCVQPRFAQPWVTLVRHLPTNDDLNSATARILLSLEDRPTTFYHPVAAPIHKEALLLFVTFLRRHTPEDDDAVESAKRALQYLTAASMPPWRKILAILPKWRLVSMSNAGIFNLHPTDVHQTASVGT